MKVQFTAETLHFKVGSVADINDSKAYTYIKLGIAKKLGETQPNAKPVKEKIQNAAENSEKQNATI